MTASDMARRVLFVSSLYPPHVIGGAEIVAHRQALELTARGWDVSVFAGKLPDDAGDAQKFTVETVEGVTVYRVVHRSLSPHEDFNWPQAIRRFTSVLSTCQPDVVHFHNVAGLGAALIPVAKRFGSKVVVTLHDHWGFCYKNSLLRNDKTVCRNIEECAACLPEISGPRDTQIPIRLRRDYVAWCLDQADHLVSPSNYLARSYDDSGLFRSAVQSISNGIDLTQTKVSTRSPQPAVQFSCFSYLGSHKGIPVLLEAAERLARDKKLSSWRLSFAGDGELSAALKLDIANGRFGDHVEYLGRLPHTEAMDLMSKTDVVVLPSIWPENQPVTLLEAIAAGKAQVATRIGGNIELVDDTHSGLLVEPGSVDGLMSALAAFISDRNLAARFGRYNAARRPNFAQERSIAQLISLYSAVPDRHRLKNVVICSGRPPPELDMMMSVLHQNEDLDRRSSFVLDEWACSSAWESMSLLWIWGEDTPQIVSAVARALRGGRPVLIPETSVLADMVVECDLGAVYADLLQALGFLVAFSRDRGKALGDRGPFAARYLNRAQPRQDFVFSAASGV